MLTCQPYGGKDFVIQDKALLLTIHSIRISNILYPCQELWVICSITRIDSDVCTVFAGSPGMSGAQSGGGSSGSSVNSSAITAGAVIGAVLIVIIVVGAFLYTKRQ